MCQLLGVCGRRSGSGGALTEIAGENRWFSVHSLQQDYKTAIEQSTPNEVYVWHGL
jgi:hypothetical protein